MTIIDNIKDILSFIATYIKSEYVALFSVLVTILIYLLNRQSELKYKKHESRREEYAKLISFLSITFTEPDKVKPDKSGKLSKEIQKQFYDTGVSLMLYASKKVYKKYIFFRDFSNCEHFRISKYYDENMILYIIADIMKQIRKEVGLSYFNQISSTETLGFFVNNFASNPVQKKKAYAMNYKIRMIKLDLLFIDCIHGVFIHHIFYKFIKPIFGIIRCLFIYIFFFPLVHVFNKIKTNCQSRKKKKK